MAESARWRQIEQIYHDALGVAEGERAVFLERACAGEEELRREVESLLTARAKGGGFLDAPAFLPSQPDDIFADLTETGRIPAGHVLTERYRLDRCIGQGGMGEVYRAFDLRLGREVAIKVLSDHLTRNRVALMRFEREARALAALVHPNILTIHEFDAGPDVSYIVTELLTGETLRARLARSALVIDQTLEIALGIAEGLAAVHDKGITHRDLKPENVFLTGEGGVKILDFGVAWVAAAEPGGSVAAGLQTESGMVIGTVLYMSPEQIRGGKADQRSDIFSFGSLLYEMISGRPPFSRGTIPEMGTAILKEEPPRLTQHIPPALERLTLKCLEKAPQDRYQSGRELLAALKSSAGHHDIATSGLAARRILPASRRAIAALLAIAIASVAASYLPQAIRQSASRRAGSETGEQRIYREVLNYYLEEGEPEGGDKTYKFHFTPHESGSFYIIAPGENNGLKTFLTDLPGPRSGVAANWCEAEKEYVFPSGDGNWIRVTSDDPITPFTIIFLPRPTEMRIAPPASNAAPPPGILRARAGRALTADDRHELEEWQRSFKTDAVKSVLRARGNQGLVAVTIPSGQEAGQNVSLNAGQNTSMPVSFEIAIRGR